jgi:carboxypeptidase Taq
VAEQKIDFTRSDDRINTLLEYVQEIVDLSSLAALADWDQQTAMPDGANEVRGHQMATMSGLVHDRQTSPQLGELLKSLEDVVHQPQYSDADRALVRDTRRAYDFAVKLPRELVKEMEIARVDAFNTWVKARANNDFGLFAPKLKKIIEFQREVADRWGYKETRYDALLDAYEPGFTAAKVSALFEPVRDVSKTMLKRIQQSGNKVDMSSVSGQRFDVEKQKELCIKALKAMGYDFNRGELRVSAHPFTTSFGSPFDVRVTTRYQEDYLPMGLMGALHEGGHAVYEQGVAPTLVRTPLASGATMGVHESQSRLWENIIGRSTAFWKGQFGLVRECFPEQFQQVSAETFARALNNVEASLIRVEADEVTYNLHIIIRFEMERAMMNEDVSVESLPSMWNAKYQDYLGITPDSDANGILQDVHWTSGFGYFPSYTFGNLYSAQIYNTLRKAYPDFDERLAGGDVSFVLNWLRENLYAYGTIYQPEELIQRVTGEAPNPQYLVDYLTNKFSQIYNL